MLCEKCKKNTATFHYTEVVNGVKNEHHLCGECASNTDAGYYSSIFDGGMHFGQLLSGLLGGQLLSHDQEKDEPAKQVKCPRCNLSYGEFVKKSAFGCAECYDVFGPLITDTIKKLQGSEKHIGKFPMIYGKTTGESKEAGVELNEEGNAKKKIDILAKKLKEAVASEDFMEAARLRDMISELREKVENNG